MSPSISKPLIFSLPFLMAQTWPWVSKQELVGIRVYLELVSETTSHFTLAQKSSHPKCTSYLEFPSLPGWG